jgi:hypothetical protein
MHTYHIQCSRNKEGRRGKGNDSVSLSRVAMKRSGRLVEANILVYVERYSAVHESVTVLKLSNIPRIRSVFLL